MIDADGAFSSATANTSGFREFAYVFTNERGQNSHPPHQDHPGHFTCDDGSVTVPPAAKTLGVTTLTLSSKVAAGKATVAGKVTVKNRTGQAMEKVQVGVIWTRPDGTSVEQFATTDKFGAAYFSTTGAKGSYRAVISESALTDYAAAANSIWTAAITVK